MWRFNLISGAAKLLKFNEGDGIYLLKFVSA
jgi:hypothetical protein